MKYIIVSKNWRREKNHLPINIREVKEIKYILDDVKYKIFIRTSIEEELKLPMNYYGNGTVDAANQEVLNKLCFYLSVNTESNFKLLKGETATNFSDIYILKLKNTKLNNMEIKLLSFYIQAYNKKSDVSFSFNDSWKKCYLNYDKNKMSHPKDTDMKLYSYQANTVYWMESVEKNKIEFSMNTSVDISDMFENNREYYFNPISSKLSKKKELQKFYYKGGILGDEMGSGKTICCASIIVNNKSKVQGFRRIDKRIYTKATLVILPGHLAKQWEFELKKFNKNLNVILYLTKVHHKKYKIEDILKADVLIVTTQFLCNKNWYLHNIRELHKVSAEDKWKSKNSDIKMSNVFTSLIKDTSTSTANNSSESSDEIAQYNLNENIGVLNNEIEKLLNRNCPILNMFYFHRIIADEAHQILSTARTCSVNDEIVYLRNTLLSLEADHYWYVSGTPFVENESLFTIFQFLRLKINDYLQLNSELVAANINRNNVYNKFLEKLYIRHTKEIIKNQLKIPPVIEENIFLEFTEIEKALYSKAYKGSIVARQMCCHPSINDQDRQAFLDSDNIPNLSETKEKIIISRENELKILETRLNKITLTNNNIVNQSEYSRNQFLIRKKELEDKINSIKYILKIFKEIDVKKNDNEEEEICPILLEPISEGVITKCGHKFSKEGLLDGLKMTGKKQCPLCRMPLGPGDIYEMTAKVDKKESGKKIDEYTYKYGTKMGKLIRMVLEIMKDTKNRIIIFSQWDSLLKLISNTLNEINISNVRCKGNTYQRNAAIMKFKKGLNSKKKNKTAIILLSLENAAAGTNLTEASHIFLVDPIKGSKEHVKATEDQCIGRACRIGQKNQVKIFRLIIKNTIEEEIFNECYK